jgi:chaperonin GroEL
MAKILLYRQEAREALGRGIEKFTRAIDGTIGPKGGNSIIDVPIGTPIVTRDGVQIASEIELEDPFENMGAQVVRAASRQTNNLAGDGTTTATVLANAIIQRGLQAIREAKNPVDVVRGIEKASELATANVKEQSVPLPEGGAVSVATVSSGDRHLGQLVADALEHVGTSGHLEIERAPGVESSLEIINGFFFDRGYLSHHLATESDSLEAVVTDARILLTDFKIKDAAQVQAILDKVGTDEPLVILAETFFPEALSALITANAKAAAPLVAVNPPEFGRWREAMMEDLAAVTGGRFISEALGGNLDELTVDDLGSADEVRSTEEKTIVTGGRGKPEDIEGRREQVNRQLAVMEQLVEIDKLEERLVQLKSGGGKALLHIGGHTGVEQRRRELLVEDAINATRHAMLEGVVPGGGMALVKASQEILEYKDDALKDDQVKGMKALADAIIQPLRCIVENCGEDAEEIIPKAISQEPGHGFNAENGTFGNLVEQGIIDPVKVTTTALGNAVSVAGLILNTQSLIADKPEDEDPTAGRARGGGAENLHLGPMGEGQGNLTPAK